MKKLEVGSREQTLQESISTRIQNVFELLSIVSDQIASDTERIQFFHKQESAFGNLNIFKPSLLSPDYEYHDSTIHALWLDQKRGKLTIEQQQAFLNKIISVERMLNRMNAKKANSRLIQSYIPRIFTR